MGEWIINGNVDCINLKIYGESEMDGNLKAADIADINGRTRIKGNLETKKTLKFNEKWKLQQSICG